MNTQPLFLLQATYPLWLSALQIARLNFINETIAHYNSTNRGILAGLCVYWTENDKSCAIGRTIPNKAIRKKLANKSDSVQSTFVLHQLPSDVQSLGESFLRMMQILHDDADYWDVNGLTASGKYYVEHIKEQHRLFDPAL